MPPPTDSRRRLTAWLGLLAVWLLVLMPLASQLAEAAAARRPDAAICTAAHSARHAPAGTALSACGYCDLLAAHSYAPPTPAPAALPLHPLVQRAAPPLPVPAPRSFATLAASARAPPPSA
ncbi:DUF2946 family protein [Burkholderia glumae]|uniref:DUF2946 family protein n=1 Tax=Burkholderia glumae TaxID=337 RepID=A0AAP9XXC5_BURGL|nr:DUF2946 family protein [Burkholderia glumae]ACR31848.1 Hypothetical protein bglu_2g14910 [Burkholderia glumae BGR1]AJY63301.1 hypothetical protein KS03_4447 [Burkholderia glumae LMG 2196 = ATCC 33617]KHJ60113.1 hypothetical protein NCPPB3923_25765 [Burkholderia glumae]MCM2484973.1 DUF2946 family protein [Burkholderia glumae]MCM2495326.1 DUF2946 family protein [Burkholderia glumae]